MFTKEEYFIIFDVFENLETENDEVKILKEKMKLIKEQYLLSEEMNKKMTDLQDKINCLTKKEEV